MSRSFDSGLRMSCSNLSQAFNELNQVIHLNPVFVAPDRLRDGVIVYADGVRFNPGSGEGPYVWDGTAWRYMIAPGPDLTKFGSVASRLFTSSGTYTPTPGTLFAIIECVGGGAGGGSAVGNGFGAYFGGGGGGLGGYSRRRVTAALIGASQTVTIGAAGAGLTAQNVSGGNGGNTSVGTLCVANGGTGGGGTSVSGSNILGGLGGAPGTGDVVAAGRPGGIGEYRQAPGTIDVGCGGEGGLSYFGGGARAANSASSNNPGTAATNYGSGGAGASTANVSAGANGGAGSPGIVVITEFGP